MTNLINGDARHIALADESVQCIITSPPYWALRSYLAADDTNKSLELGAERVPDCLGWATGSPCGSCYVCSIVAVMRECWRVLRSDGVCFLNLGDSYFGDTPPRRSSAEAFSKEWDKSNTASRGGTRRSAARQGALKAKDLTLIPSRVALALQAAGWYVRSEIIWHKPNPMPESVTDRPTKAHEMIYLLTKRAEYYYDAIAIQESAAYDGRKDTMMKGGIKYNDSIVPGQTVQSFAARGHERWPNQNDDGTRARNRRSVWTIATSPYSGAHFATFPPALVEPMILAGTSARGACPKCGKAWVRVVDRVNPRLIDDDYRNKNATPKMMTGNDRNDYGTNKTGLAKPGWRELPPEQSTTLGFAPACACYAAPPLPTEPVCPMCQGDGKARINGDDVGDCLVCDGTGQALPEQMAAYQAERARLLGDVYPLLPVVPCKVFDPFSGSGTVLRVAIKHSQIGIGNDLNLNYAPLAVDRTSKIQTVMPL